MNKENGQLDVYSPEVVATAMAQVWPDVCALVGAQVFREGVIANEIAAELGARHRIERQASIHCAIIYFLRLWDLSLNAADFDARASVYNKERGVEIGWASFVLLHLHTGAMGPRGEYDHERVSELSGTILKAFAGEDVSDDIFNTSLLYFTHHSADLIRAWAEAAGSELSRLCARIALEITATPTTGVGEIKDR